MAERVLTVGGGGREHAIVDALARAGAEVCAVMKNRNPGIARLAKEVLLAKETDVAKRKEILSKVQDIMIQRGPSYIPFFRPLLIDQSSKVTGVDLSGDPGLTNFASATIAQ